MTTFFSVDVETTGTNPFIHDLATVGAVAIDSAGLFIDRFYVRLDWGRDLVWDHGTQRWWMEQNVAAKNEMFSSALPRVGYNDAFDEFSRWLLACGGEGQHDNVFIANPSTFDFGWLQRWSFESNGHLPFSYRTLCLRSAAWGAGDVPWTETQRTHAPFIPHHAAHDAQAQALDFLDLLKGRQ